MRNRYEVSELAKKNDVPLTKVIRAGSIELTVDRSTKEIVDDLRELGVLT